MIENSRLQIWFSDNKPIISSLLRIILSYGALIVFCAVSIIFLKDSIEVYYCLSVDEMSLNSMREEILIYGSKIIKGWSFLFILLGVLKWMHGLPDKENGRTKHFFFGCLVALSTFIVFLYLYTHVLFFALNYEIPGSLKIDYYLTENIIILIPLLIMAFSNFFLLCSDVSDDLRLSFSRFLYIVYIPVITAAITIMVLAYFAHKYLGITEDLTVMVSGATAFLVFVTHCSERIVHNMDNLHLGQIKRNTDVDQ